LFDSVNKQWNARLAGGIRQKMTWQSIKEGLIFD
jgi:hypothetical protein